MKKFDKVSIIILNYNGLKYLKDTIPTILNLKYSNYEVIVVDNGSIDGSLDFIRKFSKIQLLISPKAKEKNFACNYAIRKSRGKYILLLDNDVIINQENIIRELVKRVKENKRIGCIGLALNNLGENKSKYYGGYFSYYFLRENKSFDIGEIKNMDERLIGFPHGAAFFIKRSIWNRIGGYDENLSFGGDDNDLGIKLWLFGYRNYLYSQTLCLHIGSKENKDDKKYSIKWKNMVYAHLYTITKNYSIPNMIITLPGFFIFALLKSIKQCLNRLSIRPIGSFFEGLILFILNLGKAITKRKKVQYLRTEKRDIFMKIKPKIT